MAFNGLGKLNNVDKVTKANAAIQVLSWKHKKFRILKKIPFPII